MSGSNMVDGWYLDDVIDGVRAVSEANIRQALRAKAMRKLLIIHLGDGAAAKERLNQLVMRVDYGDVYEEPIHEHTQEVGKKQRVDAMLVDPNTLEMYAHMILGVIKQ